VSAPFELKMSDVGVEASAALDDLMKKNLANRQTAEYVYDAPIAWDQFAGGGWDLIGASESDGGAGATLRDLVQVARVAGRWLTPVPLVTSIMAKRWSEPARQYEGPVTVAVSNRTRTLTPFGSFSGIGTLVATTPSGEVVSASGTIDDDFAPSLRVTEGAAAATLFQGAAARELAVVWGSEAVGCAERLLEDAVAYVSVREQFGQPVGRFQAIKHKLANALIDLQEAESAVIWAAMEEGHGSAASSITFSSALRVAEAAIQSHGGLGFTWEMGLHMHLRHILTLRELCAGLTSGQVGR